MAITDTIALLFKCYTDSCPSLSFPFPNGKAEGSPVAKDYNKGGNQIVAYIQLHVYLYIYFFLDQ